LPVVCVLQGSMIGRSDDNGPRGGGISENRSFTLTATDRHAIVIENHPQDSRVKINPDGIVQTLPGQMGTGGGNVPLVVLEE
jgi:DNA (cytosine-5)-methyltransferase 1